MKIFVILISQNVNLKLTFPVLSISIPNIPFNHLRRRVNLSETNYSHKKKNATCPYRFRLLILFMIKSYIKYVHEIINKLTN
jgi:hypothetical protein